MADEQQPTLPPGIDGHRIGTLTICFQQCSVPDAFARIQFWGGVGCDLYPNKSINFVLVGETSTIAKYMTDASPLHIKILAKDLSLIGNVFIPDLSLPAHSLDCKRSSKGVISLRQMIIGDVTFELHFRMMPTKPQLETDNIDARQSSQQQLVDIPDFEVNQLLDQASDSEYQGSSKLCGSTTQEKYSLISELLDICSDDMTLPTVDTSLVAATGVDPYDLWISNIVSSIAASSPRTSSQGNTTETITTCNPPRSKDATAVETFPHPISLFLSNVATAANATQLRSSSATQPEVRAERLPDTVVPPKLEPMQPPPIWIDVGVYCISNLRIVSVFGNSTTNIKSSHSLELNLKCSEPLLSLCDLVQSSAFSSTSNYSSDSVKTVEMTHECRDLVSMTTQLSWQAGLKSLNGDIEITLQLRCCCNDSKVIVGQVSIPYEWKQRVESSQTLGLLPRFDVNGWFDILDSSSVVGKIQLSLASGTLKQIRSLPKAHTCAAAIQRHWRLTRNNKRCIASVGEGDEAPQPHAELFECTRISLGKYDDNEDEDTIYSHPPPPPPDNSDNIAAKRTIHAESSPDSLFEEWSQQSFLTIDASEKEVFNVNAARAEDINDVGPAVAVDTSLVEATNSGEGIHAYTTMGESGAEGNAKFNPNSSASDPVELQQQQEPSSRSSLNRLDTHHNSLPNMDDLHSQRRQPIDPPEENDLPTKVQTEMKRKMDQSCSPPDAKRHRVTNDSVPCETNRLPSPPNLQADNNDMSIDDDDDMTYRSLQSVMQSLAGVEARLKDPTSIIGCSHEESIPADVALDLEDTSDLTPSHATGSSVNMTTPLETRNNTEAATVETCEKGTSPLFVTSRYKDAATATSPRTEEASIEMQDEAEDDGGVKEDTRENESEEERAGTLNNKLTRNHSTQGLFATFSTASDRRERYGSLFNSQSSYPRGTMRLSSLLSPTGGAAPRIEGSRVDSRSSNSYNRYLSGRRQPPDGGVASSSVPSFNSTSANRIEKIFSGNNNKKKED